MIAQNRIDAAREVFVDGGQLGWHRADEGTEFEPGQCQPTSLGTAGDRAVEVSLVEVDLGRQRCHFSAQLGKCLSVASTGDNRYVVAGRDECFDDWFGRADVAARGLLAHKYRGHGTSSDYRINRYTVTSKLMAKNPADPPRRYESPVRQANLQRTRKHVVATATRLFAERGYAGTSMRQLAAAAGVSLETVTQTGRKADLLLAAFRDSFRGSSEAPDLSALLGRSPSDALREELAELVFGGVDRVAGGVRHSLGIWRAFAVAAASDSTVAGVRAELAVARRQEITTWLAALEDAELLSVRDSASRGRLADGIGLIVSHEAYEHLTDVCGWSHDEYVEWAAADIMNQLGAAGSG